MQQTHPCDYCRAAIDITSDSSLLIGVHRKVPASEWGNDADTLMSGDQLTLRFCSKEHLATYMERIPLPVANAEEDISGAEVFGWLLLIPLALAAFALAVYGGVQFWQEIASGWF